MRLHTNLPPPPGGRRQYLLFTLIGTGVAFLLALLLINFVLLPWHVNMGKEAVVPDVVGMTRDDAEREIKAKGFAPGDVRYVPDSAAQTGKVVETRPRAGTRVKVGRVVSFDISAGQEKTQVPQVYKMPIRRAQAAIENAGLRVGDVITMSSPAIPEGQVISTSPEAGLRVLKGTAINVRVSLGALGAIPMPRVTGMPLDRAKDLLINNGLVLAEARAVTSPQPAGTVLTQDPPEGEDVQPGDSVHVTVAQAEVKKAASPKTKSEPAAKPGTKKNEKPATKKKGTK